MHLVPEFAGNNPFVLAGITVALVDRLADINPVIQYPIQINAREFLVEIRSMKGGSAAGVATISAAGVEVAQTVLAETQSAILPLVPYLDTLRWVFIFVALIGVSVTIYARWDDWK